MLAKTIRPLARQKYPRCEGVCSGPVLCRGGTESLRLGEYCGKDRGTSFSRFLKQIGHSGIIYLEQLNTQVCGISNEKGSSYV